MDYLLICSVSLLVAALTFVAGFGLGTLLLPAFAVFFPVETAVAATAVVHLANNLFKAVLVGRWANVRVTLRFALPAAVAAAGGALALSRMGGLPPVADYEWFGRTFTIELVKLTIGLLIGVFSLFELVPKLQGLTVPAKYIPLGGLLSGFFGGLSGHQGALRSMFLVRAGLGKEAYVATAVLSAIVIDMSRLLVYGSTFFGAQLAALGQGTLGLVWAATLAAFAGSLLGARLLKKITLDTLHRIIGALLLLVAAGLCAGWI